MTSGKKKLNPTVLEKKDTSMIDEPERFKKDGSFELKIELGKLLTRPNEPNQSNGRIELYYGDKFLARADYSGGQIVLRLLTKSKE